MKALPGNPYEGHALKTIILDSKYGGGLTAAAAFPDHVKGGARGAAPEFGRYLERPTLHDVRAIIQLRGCCAQWN